MTQSFSKKLKHKFRIGTWNVQTMKDEKLETVIKEAHRNKIEILGITEHRWANKGHFNTTDGGKMYFAGREKSGQSGVGLWVTKEKINSVLGYKPINDRLMSMRIKGAQKDLKIIQVYAPTSKASKEEREKFYTEVQNEYDDTDKNDIVVIMGDFNAKVGCAQSKEESGSIGKFAYGGRNQCGDHLVEFVMGNDLRIMNTAFPLHPRRLYTWTEPGGKNKHQIDYIAIQKGHNQIIQGVRTLPGADCGSDHELLMAEVKFKLRSMKKQTPTIRYDVHSIDDSFSVAVKNRFADLMNIGEDIEPDELANHIKCVFQEEASKHLKKKQRKRHSWISNETLEKIEERRKAKKHKNADPRYKELKREIRRLCKRDKENFFNNKCRKIENCMKENKSREMYKEIKDLTNEKRASSNVIKNANGKMLTEKEDIQKRWVEYCSEMYKSNEIDNTDDDNPQSKPNDAPPPLRAEVETAIKKLKSNKSPGQDQITTEMIIAGGEEAIDVYHRLITKIWESEKWPEDWKTSIYIPLYKKGDPQLCSNYRTIALISHASKILLNIIMNRMQTKLEQEVATSQAGFRKSRGTRDHLLNLSTLLQKHNEMGCELRICFIDYSKAFDCVSHQKMWKTLEEMSFDSKIIALLKSLYRQQKAVIKLEDGPTEPFSVSKGVRQGCILSPHLFSLYTEDIMRKVQNDDTSDFYDEPKVNGMKIRDLRYADDTALLSTTTEGLERIVKATKCYSEEKDLLLNVKKTKILDSKNCREKTEIKLENETIENVEHFQYLGATFNGDGSSCDEIRKRLAMAKQKLQKMKVLWKGLNLKTKLRLLDTCIFPIALYGCEAWTLKQTDLDKIEAFEMTCYRKLLGIKWQEKISNENVRKMIGRKMLVVTGRLKKQKLCYFGHIKRHETLEKTIMEGRVEGKRGRGRPRRQWRDDIKSWLDTSVEEAGRLAMDRQKFRRCVWAATSRGSPAQPEDTPSR